MTVTEIKQALGSWNLRLVEETPKGIRDKITFFGHIALVPGSVDPVMYGDNLLKSARYVGVLRGRDAQDHLTLKGSGMAFWLGDEDNKGDVFENPIVFSEETFANTILGLLPPSGSIVPGIINSVPGTYTGRHQWQSPREALTYVSETFGAEFRVNGDGTLDAGTVVQLYGSTPRALLLRKGSGSDLLRKAIDGRMGMGVDVEDTTTRVVLLAEGEGASISTGSADAPATPYRDLRGNPIRMTRVVSESGTSTGNAAARAQLQLNRFLNPRRAVNLSTSTYDVKGTFQVGEYLDVYDPDDGFYDQTREIYWNGERINPMALRCVELTWPVPQGWTVAFRTITGEWIDLSAYYVPEGGETTIVVGELARGMASVGGEAIGVRPNLPDSPEADNTIPGEITFGEFTTGSYQSQTDSWTKSAVLATWTQPLNEDGSTIQDGSHYELRYRVNTFFGYQVRWGQIADRRWGELSGNRWGSPITSPIQSGDWQSVFVPWGTLSFMVTELTPGVEYEFQIRAVDETTHQGVWSDSKFVLTVGDLFAPSQPAAPEVTGSPIAIQVVHQLGRSSGGTFNLEPDLAYLTVHIGGNSGFVADDSNQIGKLSANGGMVQAGIPAIGTLALSNTGAVWVRVIAVDSSGNRSTPSPASAVTPGLINSSHISELTASKITAGILNSAVVLGNRITTATSGARVEMAPEGIAVFGDNGFRNIWIKPDGLIEFSEPGYLYPPVEVGITSDGTAGIRIQDLFGDTKALFGQIRSDGGVQTDNYGIALVNPQTGALVKLSDYIFGPKKNTKSGTGGYAGTSGANVWVNLDDGEGPRVNDVVIGNFGRAIVTLTARIITTGGFEACMGFEIRNASTNALVRSASQSECLSQGAGVLGGSAGGSVGRVSIPVMVDGLSPGSYHFICKYLISNNSASSFMSFEARDIVVQPY